jgi:hypothetical protein
MVSTVDKEQRRMVGPVDRLAYLADPRGDTGRGLVVHHRDRLDLVVRVLGELGLDGLGLDAPAPVAGHEIDLQAQTDGHLAPQGGEVAGLEHHHPVARRQGVDQGRFPSAGARGRIDDDRLRGPEDLLQAVQDLSGHAPEFGPPVVDRRPVDGPENPVGDVGRSRDLQEMPARPIDVGHCCLLVITAGCP